MEIKQSRILILFIVFVSLFLIVILRLLDLQVLHHSFYEKKSQEQRTRIIDLAAQRGDIFDRSGRILATTIDTYSVFTHEEGSFKWLARKLPLAEAEKLLKEKPKQRGLLKEKKRIYPNSKFAAQLLGFVGIDNLGLSGIELAYEEYLRGKKGRVVTEGDPQGRELYGAFRELEKGSDGMDLTLTIDENIQYVAEREIEKQVKKSGALSGLCLVMGAKTGEILALAAKPDFDPNAYQNYKQILWHPRVLDPYEPGSTFKIITVAVALERGTITEKTMLKALDSIEVGGKIIENSHQVKWPGSQITISKMLEESINTGAVQVGLTLGPENFYNGIKAFGFGKRTDFGLRGESNGIVRHWKNWYKPDIGMMTFGQSIAITPLQLLSAVSAFANEGQMVQPFIVKKIESSDGNFVKTFIKEDYGRAISKKVAEEMKGLMGNVVLKGSGRRAKMEWFSVGGKTGTAQKAAPGGRGYLKGHYIASFVGMAPLADPEVLALVIVDDPRGSIWGESVCGPVFKDVVEYSLRYLNVKPDML